MSVIDASPIGRLVDVYRARIARRAVLDGPTLVIEIEHAIEEGRQNEIMRAMTPDEGPGLSLEAIEKRAIVQALRATGWLQVEAAQLLGVTARVLCYKMQQHGITRADRPRLAVSA